MQVNEQQHQPHHHDDHHRHLPRMKFDDVFVFIVLI